MMYDFLTKTRPNRDCEHVHADSLPGDVGAPDPLEGEDLEVKAEEADGWK